MRKTLFCIGLLFLAHLGLAQKEENLSPAAQLLFSKVKCKISADEKNRLFVLTGFGLSNDHKQFVLDEQSKDFPFNARVLPTDLNNDGKEEIFVVFGNLYTSGNTGTSIILFVKDAAGQYRSNLGFPGVVPDALTTSYKGYPDLVITGPGLEYPIYRWDGLQYSLYKRMQDVDYAKAKKTSIESLSKAYMASN